MTKPLIQIALDSTDLDTAVSVANNVESFVDVIEVGTILAFAEGMNAVRTLRANHPEHAPSSRWIASTHPGCMVACTPCEGAMCRCHSSSSTCTST